MYKVFVVFGVIFFVLSLFFYLKHIIDTAGCTQKTMGTVVGIKDYRGQHHSMICPIVEYTVDKQIYEEVDSVDVSHDDISAILNEKVSIFYNPKNPKKFIIEGYHEKYSFRLVKIPFIAAVIFFVIGIVLY